MCEFISWIPKGKTNLFLTYHQVFETDKGQQLRDKLKGDWYGHAGIRFFYDLSQPDDENVRKEKDCADFSTPDNFPKDIVKAIKNNEMGGYLKDNLFIMLSEQGINEYSTKCLAYADLNKAYAGWNKARADLNKADADWNKADADWNKARAGWNKADADLDKADADLDKAYAGWNKAYAGWNKARADWNKADADLDKADADLDKADALGKIFWKVFSNPLNRIEVWQ
ncbi:MAG: hypothetical protein PHS93_08920 [Candidatus Omnitrophica bacterium]|nr:hypothetical protein [Candidatus Omnitrophota bacterium]